MKQLQTALAGCCPTAAAAERQRQQRGLADLEWRGLGTPVAKYEGDAVQGAAAGHEEQPQAEPVQARKKNKNKKKTKAQQQQPPSGEEQQQQVKRLKKPKQTQK